MQPRAVFGVSVVLSLVVWGIIGARDIWPALRRRPRAEALRPLLLLHAFRFVGLAFLVPGVVSPALPDGFARPAAYGDLGSSMLALLAIAVLGGRLGTILAWACNIVGTAAAYCSRNSISARWRPPVRTSLLTSCAAAPRLAGAAS